MDMKRHANSFDSKIMTSPRHKDDSRIQRDEGEKREIQTRYDSSYLVLLRGRNQSKVDLPSSSSLSFSIFHILPLILFLIIHLRHSPSISIPFYIGRPVDIHTIPRYSPREVSLGEGGGGRER